MYAFYSFLLHPPVKSLSARSQGSITRSSQPMVGLKNARSIQDEKLIEAIFHSHSQHTIPLGNSTTKIDPASSAEDVTSPVYGATATNLIIDARPTTNAVVNSVRGAGTENMEYYKNCKKAYLGVDNIHIMRDSLKAVLDGMSFLHAFPHLAHLVFSQHFEILKRRRMSIGRRSAAQGGSSTSLLSLTVPS
jgi:hypothetical protein